MFTKGLFTQERERETFDRYQQGDLALGPVHTGRVSTFACKPFDVTCEPSH